MSKALYRALAETAIQRTELVRGPSRWVLMDVGLGLTCVRLAGFRNVYNSREAAIEDAATALEQWATESSTPSEIVKLATEQLVHSVDGQFLYEHIVSHETVGPFDKHYDAVWSFQDHLVRVAAAEQEERQRHWKAKLDTLPWKLIPLGRGECSVCGHPEHSGRRMYAKAEGTLMRCGDHLDAAADVSIATLQLPPPGGTYTFSEDGAWETPSADGVGKL